MQPMLGRKVEEGEERLGVVGDLATALGHLVP
jgi:hypothetical protein